MLCALFVAKIVFYPIVCKVFCGICAFLLHHSVNDYSQRDCQLHIPIVLFGDLFNWGDIKTHLSTSSYPRNSMNNGSYAGLMGCGAVVQVKRQKISTIATKSNQKIPKMWILWRGVACAWRGGTQTLHISKKNVYLCIWN